jgi:hypothetical protein
MLRVRLGVQIDYPFGMNLFKKNLRTQAGMRVMPSETSTDMEKVRPGTGRETGLGHVGEEPTGTYLRRVSEGITRSAAIGWH